MERKEAAKAKKARDGNPTVGEAGSCTRCGEMAVIARALVRCGCSVRFRSGQARSGQCLSGDLGLCSRCLCALRLVRFGPFFCSFHRVGTGYGGLCAVFAASSSFDPNTRLRRSLDRGQRGRPVYEQLGWPLVPSRTIAGMGNIRTGCCPGPCPWIDSSQTPCPVPQAWPLDSGLPAVESGGRAGGPWTCVQCASVQVWKCGSSLHALETLPQLCPAVTGCEVSCKLVCL